MTIPTAEYDTSTVFDFNKLLQDAKAGAAWPLGDYDFEVVEAAFVRANSGAPMIKAKLRCLVGPYANKSITNNFVMSVDNPTALSIFFRHMAAFGLDENFFRQIGTGDLTPVAASMLSRRARITIGHREWGGAMQNDVKAVKPITEGLVGGGGVPGPAMTGAMVPPPVPAAAAQYAPPAAATVAVAPPPLPVTPPAPPVAAAVTALAAVPPPPPVAVVPVAAPVAVEQPPAGYTPELWATIPEAARQAIIASQAVNTPPAPPALPV